MWKEKYNLNYLLPLKLNEALRLYTDLLSPVSFVYFYLGIAYIVSGVLNFINKTKKDTYNTKD
jgi:hypothetical protein